VRLTGCFECSGRPPHEPRGSPSLALVASDLNLVTLRGRPRWKSVHAVLGVWLAVGALAFVLTGLRILCLRAVGALSGIIAAFGSVSPVEAMPAGATAPARWSKKWFQRYLAAISSIIVAFILVVMMILIHRWTEGATCQ
jgi:uncharacterized iron-regulated membrane protein